MASLNKVCLIGNLGRDPESRTFPSGDQITTASIATTEKWKDKKTGEQKEQTEWHYLQFRGPLAGVAAQYLRKGSSVYVEGKIQSRKYEKDGVERIAYEINVREMQMLGGRPDGDGGGSGSGHAQRPAQPARSPAQAQQPRSASFDEMDDDIPF
jgi:single-strand DNA-binding protein